MDAPFHREYLLRLPLPLAQLYSRAYNAKDARSRHDNCYYLFELLIKLSACPLTACYVQGIRLGCPRVPKLDQLLLQLAFPSLGQWMAILREMARHYAALPDAASHPMGQIWDQLNRPHHDPSALVALYRRIKNGSDGQPSGDHSCTILQVFEALVQYRNGVIGHGAGRFESFYAADMGPLLFPAVNEVLAEGVFSPLGPAGARLAYLTELRAVSEGRFELGMRELTGAQGERMAPLALDVGEAAGLAPNRTVLLWPGRRAPLRLDPLVIFRESDIADEVLLLNGDRSGRQVEYLSYTTGRTERTKDMVAELAALLSILAGKEVTGVKLQELAEQSRAATPSVEALTEQAEPARRLGNYEILAEIGRGGMGVVYLARQMSFGRLVALKMLPADLAGDEVALARFRREMRALGRCDHPNIVKLLDSGTFPDGQVYYTMEYVSGCDLDQVWSELSWPALSSESSKLGNTTFARAVISASGRRRREVESRCAASAAGEEKPAAGQEPPAALKLPLPPLPPLPEVRDDPGGYVRKVVALIRDAAQALQAVHDQGIVHRDISPANLMLTPDGSRVVLMDFGLAKGQNLSRSLTEKGGFVGKLRYAAPEQLASAKLEVGPRADVRGLGVTLWELLTRHRLFEEAEDERQLTSLVYDKNVPLLRQMDPSFDRDLEAIVARATERSAGDRIESAGRLAEYLQLYLDGKPLPIRTPTLREIARRWAREHKAVAAAAAIVLATIMGALVAVTIEWKRTVAAEKLERQARVTVEEKKKEAEEQRREAENEAQKAKAVTKFLQDMLAAVDPASARGREVTVRMALDDAAKKVDASFHDQPAVEASVRTTIGATYAALGLYDAAEPQFVQAMKTRQRVLGEDSPETLNSMSNLAVVWEDAGKYPEAEELCRRALAGMQRILGKDHPDTLGSMNNLANILNDQGKCPEAEELCRQALAGRQRTLGKDHTDTLGSMNNLANMLNDQGKYPEAEELSRQALAGKLRTLGKDHPSTLSNMSNLGNILCAQRKYAEAEGLYRQALEGRQRVLGKDHPDTLDSMNNLACVLEDQGKYPAAEELDRQALAGRQRVLGKDHPSTLSSMNNLGTVLRDLRKYPEAEELYRQALAGRQRKLGKDNPDTLTSMNNLAIVLQDQDKYAEAEELCCKALEGRQRILGKDHPDTLASMYDLASLFEDQGKHPEAEELYRQALAGRQRVLRKDHPDTLCAMNNLAVVCQHEGKYAEADKLNREALEGRQRKLGKDHPDTLISMNNLAAVLVYQGKIPEAEKLHRQALEARQRILGKDHPDTLTSMNNLAAVLEAQGKHPEAEELYRQALESRQRILGKDHPDTLTSMYRLAFVFEAQGKYPEAEELYRRTLAARQRILGKDAPDTLMSMNNLAIFLEARGEKEEAQQLREKRAEILRDRQKPAAGTGNAQ